MNRVLLVNMPFSNLRWPNLGLGLLKAALAERGIGSEVAYLNYDFAERVGLDHYTWLADYFAFVLGGERLFSPFYFGEKLPDDTAYYRDILLKADPEMSEEEFAAYRRTAEHIGPFLDAVAAKFDWSGYRVVGFTDSFQQTMPSVCLAKRIKAANSDVKILFGGAACEAEMGVELLRRFEEIDYVFLGESDLTLAPLVEELLERPSVASIPPGVVGRELPEEEWDSRPATAAAARVAEMDALPVPDFDDFFASHAQSTLREDIRPLLFFETSRGCWWGQKHHCAFCGLNGLGLIYRSKSADRAIGELRTLVDRHDVNQGCSADNIFDWRYFDTFLPRLRDADFDFSFVYEMKTNLRREQVRALLDAGLGAAQLGIETFIPSVLKLVGKGATASHNLQALTWFSEAGIEVKWNILFGFPGENAEDYAALADLLPALFHLAPPQAVGRVRLDRFSRYFENPAAHGMANPRPNPAFAYVYPFPEESLARMAYYYDYDYADGRDPLDYAGGIIECVRRWRELAGSVVLRKWDRGDATLIITDTRPCAAELQYRMRRGERAAYLYCDAGRTRREISRFANVSEPAADAMIREWLERRLAVELEGRLHALAIWGGG